MARDIFGRDVGSMDYATMAKEMNAPTQNKIKTKDPERDAVINELESAVNDFSRITKDNYQEESKNNKSLVDKVVGFLANFKKQKSEVAGGSFRTMEDLLKKNIKTSNSIQKMFQSCTAWVGICKFSRKARDHITVAIKDALDASWKSTNKKTSLGGNNSIVNANKAAISQGNANNNQGGGGNNNQGEFGGHGSHGDPNKFIELIKVAWWGVLMGTIEKASHVISEGLDLHVENIWKGSLKNQNAYQENLRQILHQQIGFTKEFRESENEFTDIWAGARASGQLALKMQELELKNIQRGLIIHGKDDKARERAVKTLKSVMNSAGNTASMLNMSADATNDIFMDWHMHLAMSANDIADMGRHMQFVAKNSGLTGKELEKAIGSADKIMRSLKSAGNATLQASKNVATLSASMQKFGVAQGDELQKALTSRDDFLKSSDQMRTMLMRFAAGNTQMTHDIITGNLLNSPDAGKQLAKGAENDMGRTLKNFEGSIKGLGVEMPKDMSKMSEFMQTLRTKGQAGNELAARIDGTFRRMFNGMGTGDMEQLVKGFREAAMTPFERMDDITKKMDEMQNKGLQNLDEYKMLQKQRMEQVTNNEISGFASLNDALKTAGVDSYNQLGKDAKKSLEENLKYSMGEKGAKDFLGNLNKNASDLAKGLGDRGKTVGVDVNAQLKKLGYANQGQFTKDLQTGGDKGVAAQRSLAQVQQLIATKERTSQDPATAARELIREGEIKTAEFMLDKVTQIKNGVDALGSIGPYILLLTSAVTAGFGYVLAAMAPMASGAAWQMGKSLFSRGTAGTAVNTAGTVKSAMDMTKLGTDATRAAATGTTVAGAAAAAKKPGLLGKAGAMGKKFIPKSRGGMIAAGVLATVAAGYGAYKWMGGGANKSEASGGGVLDGIQQVFVVNWPDCICGGGNGVGGGINTTVVPMVQENTGEMELVTPENEVPATGLSSLAIPALEGGLMLSTFKGLFNKAATLAPSATAMPTTMLGKSLGMAKGLGGVALRKLGVAGALYDMGAGAYRGFGEAEKTGLSKTTATTLGALTGKATTGTESGTIVGTISDNLGLERGGLADERIGQYGAMANGAFNGAMIGGQFGPHGAAIGASIGTVVAGSAELSKVWIQGNQVAESLKASADAMISGYEMRSKQLLEEKAILKQGEDPTSKIIELQKLLDSKKNSLVGQTNNLEASKKDFNNKWLPSWINPATAAAKNDMQYDEKILATTTNTIKELEKQISGLKSSIQTPSESLQSATAENAPPIPAFSIGTQQITKGGIALVHEGEMIMPKVAWDAILSMGSGPFGNLSEKLNGAMPTIKNALIGTNNRGAFEGDQGREAISSALSTNLKIKGIAGESESPTMSGNLFGVFKDAIYELAKIILKGTSSIIGGNTITNTNSINNTQGVSQILSDVASNMISSTKAVVGTNNRGAFEADQGREAINQGFASKLIMSPIGALSATSASINKPEFSGLAGTLSNIFSLTQPMRALATPNNRGAFEAGQGKEATSSALITQSNNLLGAAINPIAAIAKMGMNILSGGNTCDYLREALSSVTSLLTTIVSGGIGKGLFESSQVKDATSIARMTDIENSLMTAMDTSRITKGETTQKDTGAFENKFTSGEISSIVNSLIVANHTGSLQSAINDKTTSAMINQKSLGMFDPQSNIFDAMRHTSITDLNNIVSSAFDGRQSTERKSILAEISNALNYEKTASEASEQHGAKASTTLMDYRDDIRGQVNPTIGVDGIRTSVEQRLTGDSSALSSYLAPDLTRIIDYMEQKQYGKLNEIANSLHQLEQMGQRTSQSTVVGSSSDGGPVPNKSGVKNIAQDKARGFWDLGFSTTNFTTIPSEGRGGTS